MSDDKKAAEEHAQTRCEEIQKRRDAGLPPYSIHGAIVADFLAGCQHVRNEERWRKYPDEKPEKAGDYIVTFNLHTDKGEAEPTLELGHFSKMGVYDGWNIPCVTHWKPITLPKEEK